MSSPRFQLSEAIRKVSSCRVVAQHRMRLRLKLGLELGFGLGLSLRLTELNLLGLTVRDVAHCKSSKGSQTLSCNNANTRIQPMQMPSIMISRDTVRKNTILS